MSDDLERSVELLERLLGDAQLRRRFRTDAATVLTEAGLSELAAGLGHGGRALMTLELRESRSSLAGVMVAAAAEGVDLAQFAEHAAPALAHDASDAVHHLMQHPHQAAPKPVHDAPAAAQEQPAKPSFAPPPANPELVPREPRTPRPADASLPDSQPPAAAPTGAVQPEAASASQPAAMHTPSEGAQLITGSEGSGHHGDVGAPHLGDGSGHAGSGGAAVAGQQPGNARRPTARRPTARRPAARRSPARWRDPRATHAGPDGRGGGIPRRPGHPAAARGVDGQPCREGRAAA